MFLKLSNALRRNRPQSDRRGGSAHCRELTAACRLFPRVMPFPPDLSPKFAFSLFGRFLVLRPQPTSHPLTLVVAAIAFPSGPDKPVHGDTSQVPQKKLLARRNVSDCARFFPGKATTPWECCLLVSELVVTWH